MPVKDGQNHKGRWARRSPRCGRRSERRGTCGTYADFSYVRGLDAFDSLGGCIRLQFGDTSLEFMLSTPCMTAAETETARYLLRTPS
jgi:hypothetical protein